MGDLALGDLYEVAALQLSGSQINQLSDYQCRFCPEFELSGAQLCDSDSGRSHAAAHRIAFEALLEPSPFLNCPICDEPQYSKQTSSTMMFDCMFNDLDLVNHLVTEHGDMLSDELVGDFADVNYLLTTFEEKIRGQARSIVLIPRTSSEPTTNIHFLSTNHDRLAPMERSSIPLDDTTASNETDKGIPIEVDLNMGILGSAIDPEEIVIDDELNEDMENAQSSFVSSGPATNVKLDPDSIDDVCNTSQIVGASISQVSDGVGLEYRIDLTDDVTVPDTHHVLRPPVSRVSCNICDWEAQWTSTATELRRSIGTHLRYHIREESEKRLNDPDVFYAAKRLLCCMDFSLEEYFEKDHHSDLSESVNAGLMEKTYHELLVKLFGITLPLVMRILHGTKGNPFRQLGRRPRRVKKTKRSDNAILIALDDDSETDVIHIDDDDIISRGNITESSDHDLADNEEVYAADKEESVDALLVHCPRPECGNSILNATDDADVVRHVAAHIRHDEARLQRSTPSLICSCGMAAYSPIGFVYHVFRDHAYERKTFAGAARTVMSYVVLLFDSMVRASADVDLAKKLDCSWTRIKTRLPSWCAYFCLEPDEGVESAWSDCSTLNDDWVRVWSDLVDEDNMPSTYAKQRTISVGDVIKLFEMHPFVETLRRSARRRSSYPLSDERILQKYLAATWRQLTFWQTGPNTEKFLLAPEHRWAQLNDVRVRVGREARAGLIGTPRYIPYGLVQNVNQVESIVVKSSVINNEKPDLVPAVVDGSDSQTPSELRLLPPGTTANDLRATMELDEPTGSDSPAVDVVDSDTSNDDLIKEQDDDTGSPLNFDNSLEHDGSSSSNSREAIGPRTRSHRASAETGLADFYRQGKWVSCKLCDKLMMKADDIVAIRSHCALHAVIEARFLCSLYIHRTCEIQVSCPFCSADVAIYQPLKFMEHIQVAHMSQALQLYQGFLNKVLPASLFLSDPFVPSNGDTLVSGASSFVVRCLRANCCGVPEVLRLEKDGVVTVADVDETIVRHMMWHVKNDNTLGMNENEIDLIVRVLNTRVTACKTARQIPCMAKEALRSIPRIGHNEADAVKFSIERLNLIGQLLFGPCKALIFTLVFPRRFVRDQCGLTVYPPCVCRLCCDEEVPQSNTERRKRVFVSYAHPVTQHVLDHLVNGDLGNQINRKRRCVCPLDECAFRNVGSAVRHVLDVHSGAVILNALPLILEDMGVAEVFLSAMETTLGEQSWQLQEALGFDAFTASGGGDSSFFDDVIDEDDVLRDHRTDCVRRRDPAAMMCICLDPNFALVPARSAVGHSFVAPNQKRVEDLPRQSMAFYREFLETTDETDVVPPSSSTPPIVVSATAEPTFQLDNSDSMDVLFRPDLEEINVDGVRVKQEPLDYADPLSELDAQAANMPYVPPQSESESIANKVIAQKLKDIKPEPDTIPHKKALPLKNLIQGPKTVAAAVAAALGAAPEKRPPRQASPSKKVAHTNIVPMVHVSQQATGSRPRVSLGKRETRSTDEISTAADESDLALGTLVKRGRTGNEPTIQRKSRSKNGKKKKTTIADLLNGSA